jgi:DNA-binding response OmpR family regulator
MLLASREFCEMLSNELEQSFTVLPCTSIRRAEEVLLSKPDALILNVFLPGMDSLAFLRINAERLPPTVIVLTTLISNTLLEELADLNISYLIRLPYAREGWRNSLASLLEKKSLS